MVAIGALVQGLVGIGMNLLAAPLLVLLDPALVPVPILLASTVHSVLVLAREHEHADWSGVGWAIFGRLPGTVLGVLAVALLPRRAFAVVVGIAVLTCVLLSVISWRPRPRPGALVVAGVASGAFGTASSIGAPPVALLYQHSAGPRVRATMAAYLALGSAISVVALATVGAVGAKHLVMASALVPFLLVGFGMSGPFRCWLDARWLRPALLTVASLGALLLIVKSL